jgi:signal transduction histidine kinase
LPELLCSLLDSLPDAVLVLDTEGLVVAANAHAERALAVPAPSAATPPSPAELVASHRLAGRSLRELAGVDMTELATLGTQALPRLRRRDGSGWAVEVSMQRWQHGEHTLCTVQLRDVEAARRVERMKDEFLATVSHELRTPLTSILGALGLMASGAAGAMPAAMQPLADAAQRNGQRLSQLIDDVLDLTKLEGDRLSLHLAPVRLDRLLAEADSANQAYAQRGRVRLALQVDPDLEGIELRLDPHRFLQVMANLLSNAIKHSPADSTVRVELRRDGRHAQVRVRDHGPGIDPRFRARLFEKFSQADPSDSRPVGGTGLGLYISRLLVERMGGHIAAEAADGGGTTFVVTLALPQAPFQRPWVLVVDADAQARQRLQRALQDIAGLGAVRAQAHLATSATSQAEGDGELPPIIVADTRGQTDAEAFCAALRRRAAGRPVLLYSDAVDHDFARQVGMPWWPKARTPLDTVVDAVREALTRALGDPP